MIPRVVHFVYGLRPQIEPFHLLHYLAIESCRRAVEPDEIRFHTHELPYGLYWDLARPLVTLERIAPVPEVSDRPVPAEIEPFRYAHHADVVRLDVLAAHGGMYADIDTIFVRPLPEEVWRAEAVIGEEAPVRYPGSDKAEPSVSNALMLAEPGAWFTTEWRRRIIDAMDGTWSGHSCRLATRLVGERPGRVRVEPRARFSPFDHTRAGMAALLEEPMVPGSLDDTASVHLCAHLWWAERRRDFSDFSAGDVTEAALRTARTPLGQLARPYLPDHGRC